MEYILFSAIGFIVASVLVFFTIYALFNVKKLSNDGILHYYFIVSLLSGAITIALSPRDFVNDGQYFVNAILTNPIAEWTTRFSSLFIIFAAFERSLFYFKQNSIDYSRILMLLILVYFWITNLLIPLFFTANQPLEIKHFYSLALSIGIALSLHSQPVHIVHHARNAFVAFVALSLLFSIINPYHALEVNYTQGYIPGLPRFYGLAPHATTMGMMVVLALWLTVAYPYQNRKLNSTILLFCFIALLLSQSKTVIASFFIGLFFISYTINNNTSKIKNISKSNDMSLYFYSFVTSLATLTIISLIFLDYEYLIYKHISPTTWHNITTFTGRDIIWEIALSEFHKSPIFGYGSLLFSESYRESINMINATDGHNQFIDALARSGLVGFSGLVALYLFMGYYSVKLTSKTNGLSLTLFTFILINSITAVPISLYSIGLTVMSYYLLLYLISANLTQLHNHESNKL